MARLVIVVDVDNADPLRDDPHNVVDELLYWGELLPSFAAGETWGIGSVAEESVARSGTFVSAEWAP